MLPWAYLGLLRGSIGGISIIIYLEPNPEQLWGKLKGDLQLTLRGGS
jgi:hypothetical protein